jgi:hypothetical protein
MNTHKDNHVKIYGSWICYNNAQTIRHSIMSVINYIDELVVVDGSFSGQTSDDGTWEIVEALRVYGKPLHHIKSKANSLYDKHNEHVAITGNNDSNIWTWQVDSDEVYLSKHAENVKSQIESNMYNGIAVRLVNINAINNGVGLTDPDFMKRDTYQMRIYRMHNGLTFKTRDNIFEHIVYNNNEPVQQQTNKIHYGSTENSNLVFNYHCLEPISATISRYKHYKIDDAENFAYQVRSLERNTVEFPEHPMKHIWRA